jgi:CDP-4-dehydro-6-deoxyglucose reductase
MQYQVILEPSGRSFVADDDAPLLDAGLRAGVALPYGCRDGACRSCQGRLVAGEVAYPDGPPECLNELDRLQGWVLLCRARARGNLRLSVEELSPAEAHAVRTLPYRLLTRRALNHDVVELELAPPHWDRLEFVAGQYVDLVLRDGRRRAFSVANAPREDGRVSLHIRRVPGGEFSEYAYAHIQPGAILRLRGGLGAFYLRRESTRPAVMVAGGTGFAPVAAIVDDALESGFDRPIHLYWGVRARRDLYQPERVAAWLAARPDLRYVPVLSEPDPAEPWDGRTGLVHEAVLEDHPDPSSLDVYMSGPPVMVEAGREQLVARGLDPARLHTDAFDHAHLTGHETA